MSGSLLVSALTDAGPPNEPTDSLYGEPVSGVGHETKSVGRSPKSAVNGKKPRRTDPPAPLRGVGGPVCQTETVDEFGEPMCFQSAFMKSTQLWAGMFFESGRFVLSLRADACCEVAVALLCASVASCPMPMRQC